MTDPVNFLENKRKFNEGDFVVLKSDAMFNAQPLVMTVINVNFSIKTMDYSYSCLVRTGDELKEFELTGKTIELYKEKTTNKEMK